MLKLPFPLPPDQRSQIAPSVTEGVILDLSPDFTSQLINTHAPTLP
ncbi:hypothetical protein [Halothece sp. PCC 7418]|nr:hypothetical protein [Halothece sp. PCC 7418]